VRTSAPKRRPSEASARTDVVESEAKPESWRAGKIEQGTGPGIKLVKHTNSENITSGYEEGRTDGEGKPEMS